MNEHNEKKPAHDDNSFTRKIAAKAARKITAQEKPSHVWFGLGMMGLIGWSVVIPTLLGVAFGIWIDSRQSGSYSWTLMLMISGLFVGCLHAWYWVDKEDKEMRQNGGKHDR